MLWHCCIFDRYGFYKNPFTFSIFGTKIVKDCCYPEMYGNNAASWLELSLCWLFIYFFFFTGAPEVPKDIHTCMHKINTSVIFLDFAGFVVSCIVNAG